MTRGARKAPPAKETIMTSLKPLSWHPAVTPTPPWTHPARRMAAASLRSASAVLAQLARRLSVPPVAPAERLPSRLEFYADAAAPEGALYLDGQLVGWVHGVKRL
jgi:hypothetical protein